MKVPDVLPYPAPTEEHVDTVCKWLLKYHARPGYDIDEAIYDAYAIANLESAVTDRWLLNSVEIEFIGIRIDDKGRFVRK